MPLSPDREVYPNAPLQYVVCEIRFPFAPALQADSAIGGLHPILGQHFPIVEPTTEMTMVFAPQGALPPSSEARTVRFLTRERRRAIYVTPTQLLVESTEYARYEDFRDQVDLAISAVLKLGSLIAGVSRIGLRYIDEIRVDRAIEAASDWTGYIDERLLAPVGIRAGGAIPSTLQGTLRYDTGPSRTMVMRYGNLVGRTVGEVPLRLRRPPADGPYFLVDVDSFWVGGEPLPEFDRDGMLGTCDELHGPVREAFESSITERLRNDVLRRRDT